MKGTGRPTAAAAALLLVAAYGWRGVTGIPAGLAYARGARAAAEARYDVAAPSLARAAVGGLGFEVRWLAGEVALGRWDASRQERRADLDEAVSCYLDAWRTCPISGWSRSGLAAVYARAAEATSRSMTPDLRTFREDPWERMDDDGKLAIGFARRAIALEPNMVAHRDALVRVTLRLGHLEEAQEAARGAAAAMPDVKAHDFGSIEPPREVLAAFAAASRSVLGRTPLLTRGGHLLALGLLEERLGDIDRAVGDLRSSLPEPGSELERAERRYHLGRILIARGQVEEGEALIVQAASRPEFAPATASLRARVAEGRGDFAQAVAQMKTLRRLRPGEVEPCLEFARLAIRSGDLTSARESLRWAKVLAADDPRVPGRLVEVELAAGNLEAAKAALEAFERVGGDPVWAMEQRRRIEEGRHL